MTWLQYARTFFGGVEISDSDLGYLLWNETAFPMAPLPLLAQQLTEVADSIRNYLNSKGTTMKNNDKPLSIQGRAGDPIWLMADGQEDFPIGMRLDCGDGGVVYLSTDQATELARQLNSIVVELAK